MSDISNEDISHVSEEKQEIPSTSSSLFIKQQQNNEVEIKSNRENVKLSRNLKTIALAMGFFMSGFDLIIWGLALPTLAENMKKTITELSPVIFARGAGFLVGSIAIGLTEGFMDIELAISLALTLLSIGLFCIPIIINFASLLVFSFMTSFGLGAFETVGNVFCIKLWGDKAQIVLQVTHFFFCLGCVASPLVTKPFINDVQNTTLNNDSDVFRDIIYVGDTNLPYVSIIYIIIALVGLAIAMYFLFLKFFFESASGMVEEETGEKNNKWFRIKLLAILFFIFFFFIGTYLTMSTFLYTFAVSDVPGAGYTKDQASDLNTVYLVGVTVGQFLSIFMAKQFSPAANITLNMTVVLLCSIALLFLPYYSETMAILWVILVIHGVFLSPIYGFFYSWANEYIVVDGRASSIFTIGGSCGEMVLPLLLGIFIDTHPMYFLYSLCLYVAVMIVTCLIGVKVARNYGSKKQRNKDDSKSKEEEACLETKT